MSNDKRDPCVQVLIARTGWGRLQAEAFVKELTPDERQAIAACGLGQEHAVPAQRLLDEISDRVQSRRKMAAAKAEKLKPKK